MVVVAGVFSTWNLRSGWLLSEYRICKVLYLGTCPLNAVKKKNTQIRGADPQLAEEFQEEAKAKGTTGVLASRTGLPLEIC